MTTEHITAAVTADMDPGLQYRSLGDFLRFFSPTYRRQVTDKHDTVWCPEPWLHPEGYERLEGLWLSREAALASDELRALTDWWLFCADPTMRVLLDPAGPFRYCSVHRGHRADALAPLPMHFDKAPASLFAAPAGLAAVPDAAA